MGAVGARPPEGGEFPLLGSPPETGTESSVEMMGTSLASEPSRTSEPPKILEFKVPVGSEKTPTMELVRLALASQDLKADAVTGFKLSLPETDNRPKFETFDLKGAQCLCAKVTFSIEAQDPAGKSIIIKFEQRIESGTKVPLNGDIEQGNQAKLKFLAQLEGYRKHIEEPLLSKTDAKITSLLTTTNLKIQVLHAGTPLQSKQITAEARPGDAAIRSVANSIFHDPAFLTQISVKVGERRYEPTELDIKTLWTKNPVCEEITNREKALRDFTRPIGYHTHYEEAGGLTEARFNSSFKSSLPKGMTKNSVVDATLNNARYEIKGDLQSSKAKIDELLAKSQEANDKAKKLTQQVIVLKKTLTPPDAAKSSEIKNLTESQKVQSDLAYDALNEARSLQHKTMDKLEGINVSLNAAKMLLEAPFIKLSSTLEEHDEIKSKHLANLALLREDFDSLAAQKDTINSGINTQDEAVRKQLDAQKIALRTESIIPKDEGDFPELDALLTIPKSTVDEKPIADAISIPKKAARDESRAERKEKKRDNAKEGLGSLGFNLNVDDFAELEQGLEKLSKADPLSSKPPQTTSTTTTTANEEEERARLLDELFKDVKPAAHGTPTTTSTTTTTPIADKSSAEPSKKAITERTIALAIEGNHLARISPFLIQSAETLDDRKVLADIIISQKDTIITKYNSLTIDKGSKKQNMVSELEQLKNTLTDIQTLATALKKDFDKGELDLITNHLNSMQSSLMLEKAKLWPTTPTNSEAEKKDFLSATSRQAPPIAQERLEAAELANEPETSPPAILSYEDIADAIENRTLKNLISNFLKDKDLSLESDEIQGIKFNLKQPIINIQGTVPEGTAEQKLTTLNALMSKMNEIKESLTLLNNKYPPLAFKDPLYSAEVFVTETARNIEQISKDILAEKQQKPTLAYLLKLDLTSETGKKDFTEAFSKLTTEEKINLQQIALGTAVEIEIQAKKLGKPDAKESQIYIDLVKKMDEELKTAKGSNDKPIVLSTEEKVQIFREGVGQKLTELFNIDSTNEDEINAFLSQLALNEKKELRTQAVNKAINKTNNLSVEDRSKYSAIATKVRKSFE